MDISPENIRAYRNPTGKLFLKVLPPYLTYCSFPPRKVTYRNQTKDLGETLAIIFK